MILLTTSRRPTRNVRAFCRDLSHVIPGTLRVNRGKLSKMGVAGKALELKAEKVAIIDRWKGGPGKIQLFRVAGEEGLKLIPPIIYLRSVTLRREIPGAIIKGRRIKSIAIEEPPNTTSNMEKFKNACSEFFEIPIISQSEVLEGKYDASMKIFTDNAGYLIVTFILLPEKIETGPRMKISHLIWETNHAG